MSRTVQLEVTHPELPDGPIRGFRFIWAYYVNGFRPDRNCQPCFLGTRVREFWTSTAGSGVTLRLDRLDHYPYLYVCGVAEGPAASRGGRNLQLPLVPCSSE